jgi:predicted nucleic acid-binding protein
MIVADTNLVVYLLINGEYTQETRAAYLEDRDWVAPSSCRVEFLNVLSTHCRVRSMKIPLALDIYRRAQKIVRDIPIDVDPGRVLELSVASGRSGYDCMFVAAAQMNGLPLVTFDRQLREAFTETAILPAEMGAWFSRHRPSGNGE